MNKPYINTGLVWAFSNKALDLYNKLLSRGIDPDLAICMVEQEIPEQDLYEIPVEVDDGHEI